jgi:hypothetical protein
MTAIKCNNETWIIFLLKKIRIWYFEIITHDDNDNKTYCSSNSEYLIKTYSNSFNKSILGKNTIKSKIDEKVNQSNGVDEIVKLSKIKELMICFLCNKNAVLPKICPSCRKIACKECLKKWFIVDKNNKCFYCGHEENYNNMIGIPIISNISIILNQLKSIIFINNSNYKLDEKTIAKMNIFKERKIKSNTKKNLTLNNENTNLELNAFNNLKNKKLEDEIKKIPFNNKSQKDFLIPDYCLTHPDQPLFYYCLDCKKSYCRTCFVFFGKEKNNHNGHNIIDYQNMKKISNNDISNAVKYLKDKSNDIINIIEEYEVLKKCYTFEKEMVNNYMKCIINKYNEKIDERIKEFNELINYYKKYIEKIRNIQDNIQKYFFFKHDEKDEKDNIINKNNLLISITKINNLKISNNLDIYTDLSPKIMFKLFQTEIKQFNITDMNYRYKAKLNDSQYTLIVLKKEKEIQIYIYYPKENIPDQKIFLPYVYLKKSGNNWEIFKLNEFITYKNNNYYIKRFDANNFCKKNDFIKIKGALYEAIFK